MPRFELWRSNSERVTQRTISEARAGRFSVDAVETIGTDLERMTREKIFAEFYSPHLADLIPASFVQPASLPARSPAVIGRSASAEAATRLFCCAGVPPQRFSHLCKAFTDRDTLS